MDSIIYSYGSGETLRDVFNGISLVLYNKEQGVFNAFVRIGLLTGGLTAALAAIQRSDVRSLLLHWFLPAFACLSILFVPQRSVKIVDPVAKFHGKVDNVPLGIAVIAGTLSSISHSMTQTMEMGFSQVDDLKYHKAGAMFASNLILEAQQVRITNEDLKNNMREFVTQCVAYDALLDNGYTLQELKTSPDIWKLASENASKFRFVSYKAPKEKAKIVTCAIAAKNLESALKDEVLEALSFLQRKIFGKSGDINSENKLLSNEIKTNLPTAFSEITKMSEESADALMRQVLMMHAVVEGIEHKSVNLGNAPKFAAKRAYLQQRTTYQTLGALACLTLPILKSVLEALIYALFIFMIPLSLIQGGLKVVSQWVKLVMWVNLWPPLYAIINGISMSFATKASTAAVGTLGMTIATSAGLMDANADAAATAGYLSFCIPILSWGLASGSMVALSNFASSLTAVSQSAATTTAQEAVTGNYSFGNVQAMNTNAHNWTSSQYNDSPSFNSGGFRMSDGRTEQIVGSDSSRVFNVATSNLPTSVNLADMQSSQIQDQISQAQTVANQHSVASQESLASAGRQLIEKGFAQNQQRAMSGSHNTADTMSNQSSSSQMANLTEKFAKDNNIQVSDAASMFASLGAGYSAGAMGARLSVNAGGQAMTSTRKAETLQKAQDFMRQHNWQQLQSAGFSAAKEQRISETDDQSKRFNESISASLDRSEQYRSDASVSLNKADTLSKQLSHVQQNSASINRNATQDVLEWVATQPQGGKGPMGMKAAASMATHQPEVFQSYAQQWLHHKGGVENYSAGIPTPKDITTSYQSQSKSIQNDSQQGYDTHKNSVQNRDYSSSISDQGLVSKVEDNIQNQKNIIKAHQRTTDSYGKVEVDTISKELDRSVVQKTVERAAQNSVDTVRTAGVTVKKTVQKTAQKVFNPGKQSD